MRDLTAIRNYVHQYLDLTTEDLPYDLIDAWVSDGYQQIIQTIRRWPHFETEATVTTVPGQRSYELPTSMEDVLSVDGEWGVLDHVDYATARDKYHLYGQTVSQGHARAWSLRAGQLHIWPLPDGEETLVVVGFRAPNDWITTGAGAVPDMPASLEGALLAWVMYQAHLHQNDAELAAIERQKFQEALDTAISFEIKRPSAFPLVLGGGARRPHPLGRPTFPWEF